MQRIAVRISAVIAVLALVGCASEANVEINARPAVVEQPLVARAGATETYAGEVRARHEGTLGFRIAGKLLTRNVDAGAVVNGPSCGPCYGNLAPLVEGDVCIGTGTTNIAKTGAGTVVLGSSANNYDGATSIDANCVGCRPSKKIMGRMTPTVMRAA